jgi:hypothetical protein
LQLARLSQHAANSFPGAVLHATDCFLGENQHAVKSIPKEISTRQIPFQKKLACGKFRSRRNQHADNSVPEGISMRIIPFQKELARGKFRSRRNWHAAHSVPEEIGRRQIPFQKKSSRCNSAPDEKQERGKFRFAI